MAKIEPAEVLGHRFQEVSFEYTERDAALYALAVGACGPTSLRAHVKVDEESSECSKSSTGELQFAAPLILISDFKVFPTFGVIFPASLVDQILSLQSLRFDPALLLHGEHYLELFTPSLPTEAKVMSSSCIAGLLDKGKSAVLEVETESLDSSSGQPLCLNSATVVLRGAGGFGKGRQSPDASLHRSKWRGPQLPLATSPPPRSPDHTVSQTIPSTQALLYRLCGDYNPLHADPSFAENAGFSKPILHGLCTLGFACRALLLSMKPPSELNPSTGGYALRRVRCRFLLHVFPGETLETKIWLSSSDHSEKLIRASLLVSVSRDGKEKPVLAATAELAPAGDGTAWSLSALKSSL